MDVPGNVPEQMADFARREIADYYGYCTGLDAQMARLTVALERLGIADNTIVCYTSDHGDHLSSHSYGKPTDNWLHESMRASKATPYEESIHVPFVVRWPGVTPTGTQQQRLHRRDRSGADAARRLQCAPARGAAGARRVERMAG